MLLDRPIKKELNFRQELEAAILDQDMAQIQHLVRENLLLINIKDENGRTPLHFAATEGNLEAARFLLDNDAVVDTQDNWKSTPLLLAISEEPLVLDRASVVTLLIENGANIHGKDNAGNTPLHMAALGQTEIVQLLLEHGADVNAINDAGETPLHKAVQYPEYKIVRELLRYGGDKSIRNAPGLTPMQIAKARGWANLVELLDSTPFEREAA
jgi:ankyrin repeat protein